MPHFPLLLRIATATFFAGLATAVPAQFLLPAKTADRPTLVLGFMGGRVKASNFVHKEAVIARDLRERNGERLTVLTFANHDAGRAMNAVLHYLDEDGSGTLTDGEKKNARIVLYGHSWGASETVNIARRLERLGVPVLLTIQVDSVQKFGEDDQTIPANVHRAMNFYQTEGLLSGRRSIRAADPAKTMILGNNRVSYKSSPVDTSEFPWFARTFMRPHIEIENDPKVWDNVQAMIQQEVDTETRTQSP
ncbi:hypothetical protein Terro_1337 [Terriglobus roseus DSM 18391]|uniref:Thioesterase domain-containing protein n=1 Tax=Terriglobus roseus (strain DSM 18391 / NRRL B-41598 / KBS 63) TaxID=926566 RepID=I3ZEH8_TERRK|nr:alpha/beta hydrolase [Terriglobus roseus]AFL87646.1 hypothetical protein Terro_1337 [Terriglobus roseus DSM 18391]